MEYFTLNSMFIHFVELLLIALVAMLGQLDQLLGIFYYRLAHPQIFSGLTGMQCHYEAICMCSELTWIAAYHVAIRTFSIINILSIDIIYMYSCCLISSASHQACILTFQSHSHNII